LFFEVECVPLGLVSPCISFFFLQKQNVEPGSSALAVPGRCKTRVCLVLKRLFQAISSKTESNHLNGTTPPYGASHVLNALAFIVLAHATFSSREKRPWAKHPIVYATVVHRTAIQPSSKIRA
jgi:hypothetical protein